MRSTYDFKQNAVAIWRPRFFVGDWIAYIIWLTT